MTSLEAKVNQLEDENAALTRIIAQLKAALRQERLRKAQVELEERIAVLPPDAKERLRNAFPNTDLNGLKQAIKIEQRGEK